MRLIEGQIAVVTGGASGIGFALAEEFARRGMHIGLADIEESALQTAADRLGEHGTSVVAVRTDVSDPEQVEQLRAEVMEAFGQVDVICNNAGVIASPLRPLWEFALDDWRWLIDVNLWGVINGLRTFVPGLVEQGYGHIVNTASLAGLVTVAGIAPYTATKRAVVGLSETLQVELAEHAPGVGVTVMCPGQVTTRLGESSRNRPGHQPDSTPPTTEVAPPSRSAIEPSEAATLTLEAVEAGRLYVAPGHGVAPLFEARVQGLLADLIP